MSKHENCVTAFKAVFNFIVQNIDNKIKINFSLTYLLDIPCKYKNYSKFYSWHILEPNVS